PFLAKTGKRRKPSGGDEPVEHRWIGAVDGDQEDARMGRAARAAPPASDGDNREQEHRDRARAAFHSRSVSAFTAGREARPSTATGRVWPTGRRSCRSEPRCRYLECVLVVQAWR